MIRWATRLLCLFAVTLPLHAADQTVKLTEHLNRLWQDERVVFDVNFDKAADPSALRVIAADGTAIPFQILKQTDVEEGAITDATIAFCIDELKPLETLSFRVTDQVQAAAPKIADNRQLMANEWNGVTQVTNTPYGIGLQISRNQPETKQLAGPIAFVLFYSNNKSQFLWANLDANAAIKSRDISITERGPVTTTTMQTWTFTNGATLTLTISLNACDRYVTVREERTGESDVGWSLALPTDATQLISINGQRNYAKEVTWDLTKQTAGETFLTLSPWVGDTWFNNKTNVFRLPTQIGETTEQFTVSVTDVGDWVEPQFPPPWARFDEWDFPVIGQMWAGWENASAHVRMVDGEPRLVFPPREGVRVFTLGLESDSGALLAGYQRERMSLQSPMPRLEDVQRMVLDWPDGDRKHPVALISPEQLAAAPDAIRQELVNEEKTAGYLNKLGSFDIFRYVVNAAGLYDMLIDSPDLPPETRRLYKAQMAYLAYVNAGPLHWSFDRGMASGNPNMTVARVTNIGKLGLILYDHPMSDEWVGQTRRYMDFWLENVLDVDGGWPESSHYARVAYAEMLIFAIMARRAGVVDYFQDPRFQKMAAFYEKTLTPTDPTRKLGRQWEVDGVDTAGQPVRATPPYGRGTRGAAWGLAGLSSQALREIDPELAGNLAWSWARSGYTRHISHGLGGQERLYWDATIPQVKPTWQSEYLASLGFLLRARLGEADESYLLYVTEDYQSPDGQIWPPDVGSIAKWFAGGKPVGGHFRRIPEETSALLTNRVQLAINHDPASPAKIPSGSRVRNHMRPGVGALLPGVDFAMTTYHVTPQDHHLGNGGTKTIPAFPKRTAAEQSPWSWQRWLMLDHGAHGFLALHDYVLSDHPTQWQMWTLTNGITTPQDAAASEPLGLENAPLQQLDGRQFVALGQQGMDIHYYVAAPTDSPIHTLRHGHKKGAAYAINNFSEFQDLLYLQQETKGEYYVLMLPRPIGSAAPVFTTLDGGHVIHAKEDGVETWIALGENLDDHKSPDGSFVATAAGSLQKAGEQVRMTLSYQGKIGLGDDYYLACESTPVSLHMPSPDQAVIDLQANDDDHRVYVDLPGNWTVAAPAKGVTQGEFKRFMTLDVSPGVSQVTLKRAD